MRATKRVLPLLRLFAAGLSLLAPASLDAAEKWELRYLYDQNDSSLVITDFRFQSAQRGIAAGYIRKKAHVVLLGEREIDQPVALITSDAGKTWSQVEMKEIPNSLFFLDDSTGWMAADGGVWFTSESGRTWKRISGQQKLSKVYFLSATHGFAAGRDPLPLETNDGGKTWKPVSLLSPLQKTKGSAVRTLYREIAFDDSGSGIIAGEIYDPHDNDLFEPSWMRAESSGQVIQNQINVLLVTHDGGKTWSRVVRAMYGHVTRIVFPKDVPAATLLERRGLAIREFPQFYPWPSDLNKIDLTNVKTERLTRERDRVFTDILCTHGDFYLAGYQTPGHVHPSPLPGKLKLMRSSDLTDWTDMQVDYRAVARQVWLASAGGKEVWAATDTGMILKLEERPEK